MLQPDQFEKISAVRGSIQLISFALISGVLVATLIFVAITDWQQVHAGLGRLAVVGVVTSMTVVVAAFLLPRVIANTAAQQILEKTDQKSDGRLFQLAKAFQTRTIIQFALLESAALLNLVFFFLEKSLVSLGLTAVMIALMLLAIPRSGPMEDWISERLDG